MSVVWLLDVSCAVEGKGGERGEIQFAFWEEEAGGDVDVVEKFRGYCVVLGFGVDFRRRMGEVSNV